MSRDSEYHQRPEWSYSSMKQILKSGIDYAVGARKGLTPAPDSPHIDLGECAHMMVLGGEAKDFALCEFPDFRTKAAREWKLEQEEAGKTIITQSQFEVIDNIVKNIENHPLSKEYLLGKGFKHEVELYATAVSEDGSKIPLRGKADALKVIKNEALIITDIKTTAQFDDFKKRANWKDYDLQAAVYTLIGASSMKINPNFVNYFFCVAETVKPYRVKYFHASLEFLDAGERKLHHCIEEIADFGCKEPNFLYPEVEELGDFSL